VIIKQTSSDFGSAQILETAKSRPAPERSFAADLKAMTGQVDSLQREADQAMESAAVNGAENIHETMLKVEEANLSLRLMLRLRAKALDAYEQMMRMQF